MKSIYVFGMQNPFALVSVEKELWQPAVKVKKNIYQKSVLTFTDEGIDVPKEKIKSRNEWWNEQLHDDLSKAYVGQMLDAPADFVYVDALSSTVPVCEVSCGDKKTRVTCSNPMADVLQALEGEGIVNVGAKVSLSKMAEPDIRGGVKLFCEKLLSVYKPGQIIIHLAGYPEYYINDGDIVRFGPVYMEKNKGNIKAFNIINSAFKENLPGARFIEMPSTVYSQNEKQAFNYCQEYIDYVFTSVMMYIEPGIAQKLLNANCTTMFMYRMVQSNMHMPASPEKQKALNVQAIIDDYEFKLESYNRKFREYEDKFLELYNFIMDTNYESMPWPEDELSFSEFINLKQNYPIEYRKK